MYAIYLRKSRKDRELERLGNEETLKRHEKALSELAEKRGYDISRIYREVASGETIEARPEMQKLLRAVERGEYKGVLVMEVERLARGNTKDQGIVSEAFGLSNTLIITPAKTYDTSDEFDEEYFEFGLFMSRREYKTINRRIQRGRLASVYEGKYIGAAAPYGYKKIKLKNAKGFTLKPDENSETVRLIFRLYTDTSRHLSMKAVAESLDKAGIKPPKAEHWSRSSVKDILTNPVYTGKIRWQMRRVIKTSENGKIIKHRPKQKDYILTDGLHPPVISEAVFNRAGDIMKARYKPPVSENRNLKNPFAGLLYCGKCGGRMTRISTRTGDFLKCLKPGCENKAVKTELMERALSEAVEPLFKGFSLNLDEKGEAYSAYALPYKPSLEDCYLCLKEPRLKNLFLKEIVEKIVCTKTEKGAKGRPACFEIKIYPKILPCGEDDL